MIEFKKSEYVSIFFTPLNIGTNKYQIEYHDFLNLETYSGICERYDLDLLMENVVTIEEVL